MQTFFAKYKIKDNSRDSIREWADFLNKHKEQALESLCNERVAFELAALDEQSDGLYLVYAIKAEDINDAFEILRDSKREIDVFHKKILSEILEKPQKLQILIDFQNFIG